MEENQGQNSGEFNFSDSGNGKNKKGLGPVKGLLLALVIVFLCCVIGLLIRMVVAGDGDYFKPIKDMFGIESEDDKKSAKEVSDVTSSKKPVTSGTSTNRYSLLSTEAEAEDVKHYRLTFDMADLMDKVKEQMETTFGDDSYYDDEDSYYDDEDSYYDDEDGYYDDIYNSYFDDEDSYYDDSYGDENSIESIGSSAMMMLSMMSDMTDLFEGEIYFDVYFKGNEIIEVVMGIDYGDMIENLYDYLVKEYGEEYFEDDELKIESADDLLDYVTEQFDESLNEDMLCDMIYEDEDAASGLDELGIKEKDIKEMLDINNDKGLLEIYIKGTTKLRGITSMLLDSSEIQKDLKELEDESDFEFDEDNLIESLLEFNNSSDDYEDLGIEFVEVK